MNFRLLLIWTINLMTLNDRNHNITVWGMFSSLAVKACSWIKIDHLSASPASVDFNCVTYRSSIKLHGSSMPVRGFWSRSMQFSSSVSRVTFCYRVSYMACSSQAVSAGASQLRLRRV